MDELYVKVIVESNNSNNATCYVPLESLITLFIYKYCNSTIKLFLVKCEHDSSDEMALQIDLSNFIHTSINERDLPVMGRACVLPVIIIEAKTVIAGLCSVSRQIIKISQKSGLQKHVSQLLGFRNACLMSPNESSIWTKFCEIDIVTTLKSLLMKNDFGITVFTIPVDMARFECHMHQPVRAHNAFKLALDLSKDSKKLPVEKSEDFCLKTPDGQGQIELKPIRVCKQRGFKSNKVNDSTVISPLQHKFAEGVYLTLADIILFPCFYIIFKCIKQEKVFSILPLTIQWFEDLLSDDNGRMKTIIDFLLFPQRIFEPIEIKMPEVENHSLYKSDPKRYKPRNRNYTKQEDIENVLHSLSMLSLDIKKSENMPTLKAFFDWDSLPFEALPEGGELPEKRRTRKAQQLENLAKAVIEIARPGDHIIDFCSGSGHLGIIIAFMLPKCTISLLENKEESMNRAKLRVAKLCLSNVSFFQCNLDFFKADFQIGVSLHACGVVTDLVMQNCIEKKANFVCCPCCYGNVHNCHHLTYPRSQTFQNHIGLQAYLVLGHGADQTHDVENAKTAQGEVCMDFIDKDRILKAQECGYEVELRKLHPTTCTPKNNLLIGLHRTL